MTNDPIVSEVRETRRRILESFGWDHHKLLADVIKRQAASGRKTVSFDGREKARNPPTR